MGVVAVNREPREHLKTRLLATERETVARQMGQSQAQRGLEPLDMLGAADAVQRAPGDGEKASSVTGPGSPGGHVGRRICRRSCRLRGPLPARAGAVVSAGVQMCRSHRTPAPALVLMCSHFLWSDLVRLNLLWHASDQSLEVTLEPRPTDAYYPADARCDSRSLNNRSTSATVSAVMGGRRWFSVHWWPHTRQRHRCLPVWAWPSLTM